MIPPDARLLAALRGAAVHLSVGELASDVGAAPEVVESRVRELRAAGFDIELRPGFGYRLLSSPDRIIADDLWARLSTGRMPELVREILVFEETGSTNDVAAQFGRQGAAGGLVIFAERQTAGRGRFGRRWESASHRGLWFSLLLRPDLPLAQWTRLTTWGAAGIAAACAAQSQSGVSIKWPNDVMLGGQKAAGILIELGTDADQNPFAVAGIGINVNHEIEDFPEELRQTATSLRQAAGRELDRTEIAAAILLELDRRFARLNTHFEEVLAEATDRSLLLGQWVRVQVGQLQIEGVAEALDANGQLLLRTADGALERLAAGEVTLRRSGFDPGG